MKGELFKIGTQVHGLTKDHDCFVCWITAWHDDLSKADVQGMRSPGYEIWFVTGAALGHVVPSRGQPRPEASPDDPALLSFHLPGECPWAR